MNIANAIADELSEAAFWCLFRHIPREDAKEVANNIRSAVYSEVRDAIANAIGEEQDRITEDAIAERHGLN